MEILIITNILDSYLVRINLSGPDKDKTIKHKDSHKIRSVNAA